MTVRDTRPADRFGRRLLRLLGRPAGGAAVAWVPLAAVVCGLFTGALASRAAWETSRPQPDRAEAAAILTEVFPGHDLGEIDTPPALFVVYGHALRLKTVRTLLFGDGGEYQESATGAAAFGAPPVPAAQIVAVARERLTGAGWRVYDPQVSDRVGCADKFCATREAISDTALTARRGHTILSVPSLLEHHSGEPHPTRHPYWEWLGQPTASLLFLVGAVCALLALALAAGARRGGAPAATAD
ncbi:hypothetical protein AB0B74_14200 [Micromonospora parva]|uniref:hypothetical protein n=1 Tax=Micromonospora parva TaxID=1464048 RepID=UPI00340912C9